MRLLLAFAALFAATIAMANPPRDWRTHFVQTTTGTYALGNPAAKVKLVEYVSYTCPHCAHFVEQAKPVLKDRMVRNGTVQLEIRHAVLNPADLAAVTLARCAGTRGFWGATEAMFAAQPTWLNTAGEYLRANQDTLRAMGALDQLKSIADGAGLSAMMRGRGMTRPRINACFSQPNVDRITAISKASLEKINATPSFAINGTVVTDVHDWAGLEPKLRAAGAR